MGQFDNVPKPGREGRRHWSVPRAAFPEDTQASLPPRVEVAQVEGYDPKETDQGGPAADSLPVRANIKRPAKIDATVNGKRYVKPEETAGAVNGETVPAPSKEKLISLRRSHAEELKMQTVPGVEPTSQPWTPEEDANPEATTTLEIDEEASKKFGITKTRLKPKYAEEQAQAERGAEIAQGIQRHITVYGKGPASKPLIEADQQEVKPGIEEMRRERKLKKKRGIKNSGMFDKEGNPIESTKPGNRGGTTTSAPRVNDAEGLLAESRPADVYEKPEVAARGTVIPLHNIFPKRDFGKTTRQLQKEQDRTRANRGPVTRTTELDLNQLPSAAQAGRSSEQEIVAKSKLNERFDAEERRPMHSDEVIGRAKRLAARDPRTGGMGLSPQVVNHPAFEDMHRDLVRKAYVMHHAGIAEDEGGADTEHLAKYTGTGTTANQRVDALYKSFQNKERFEKSKTPGTGYTYSVKQGNLNPATDHFRTRSGEVVPLSNMAHPEHPGLELEGSAVGFMGFTHHPSLGGQPLVKGNMSSGKGEWIHQGWHPYTDKEGRRVFEHHTIPQTAVHNADIFKEMVTKKISPNAARNRLKRGASAGVDINGLNVLANERSPEGRQASDSAASREAHANKADEITTAVTAAAEGLAAKKEASENAEGSEEAKVSYPPKPSKNEIIAGNAAEGKFVEVTKNGGPYYTKRKTNLD